GGRAAPRGAGRVPPPGGARGPQPAPGGQPAGRAGRRARRREAFHAVDARRDQQVAALKPARGRRCQRRRGPPARSDAGSVGPDRLWPVPELWRLLTYGFCHVNTSHIFFNMFSLWLFGKYVEPIYGAREFLAFYLVGILISGLAFLGFDAAHAVPHGTIGAS